MIFFGNLYASNAFLWANADHSWSVKCQAHLQRVKLFFFKSVCRSLYKTGSRAVVFCCSISAAVSSASLFRTGDSGSAGTTAHVLKKRVLCASFYKCQRCQTTRDPSLSWTHVCVDGINSFCLIFYFYFFPPSDSAVQGHPALCQI